LCQARLLRGRSRAFLRAVHLNVMRKVPANVWIVAGILAGVRFVAFWAIDANVSRDVAQWQLSYIPLLLADLPISAGYMLCRVPFPIGEAIVGPIWWFTLPIVIWGVRRVWHTRQRNNGA